MRKDDTLLESAKVNGFIVNEKSRTLVLKHTGTGRKKEFVGCDRYSHAINYIEHFPA